MSCDISMLANVAVYLEGRCWNLWMGRGRKPHNVLLFVTTAICVWLWTLIIAYPLKFNVTSKLLVMFPQWICSWSQVRHSKSNTHGSTCIYKFPWLPVWAPISGLWCILVIPCRRWGCLWQKPYPAGYLLQQVSQFLFLHASCKFHNYV